MNIRQATIEDAAAIHALAMAAFGRDQVPLTLIEQQLNFGRVTYLVMEDFSAFLSYRQTLDEVDLSFVAVKPNAQGKGLGQSLLQAMLAQLQDVTVYLEVAENNQVARHLYEKAGFQIYARREKYYHDGQTAIMMEKSL
ncbi:acetyltransferase [Fructobacillus pseudoficulneus]|uniref:Acetyltransferase n=1 Tax=Fructobacillus pseudoficulneus TaxID=220714 RepID=A0A3F3GUW5_9LACO|nr:GNAT family N-acetyltransferase [Fructobacillus pseudoficulneus]GAP03135.1 acetyltransferase [Fructobacillus pseudoficulneus]SEH41161.1 ribosomal-protein-alanine N-acetyltransferase [Fructobacillus pseudoficulneus]